jgi:potassium channel subfamily K
MYEDDETEFRLQGRRFMLSVTFFLVVIGFQAFAYSRLEGWLYSDAIYFSVQWQVSLLFPLHSAYRLLKSPAL